MGSFFKDFYKPGLVTDKLFGKPDQGQTPPPAPADQPLPVESTDVEDQRRRRARRASGRRKTILTEDNSLGAGDVEKKRVLG